MPKNLDELQKMQMGRVTVTQDEPSEPEPGLFDDLGSLFGGAAQMAKEGVVEAAAPLRDVVKPMVGTSAEGFVAPPLQQQQPQPGMPATPSEGDEQAEHESNVRVAQAVILGDMPGAAEELGAHLKKQVMRGVPMLSAESFRPDDLGSQEMLVTLGEEATNVGSDLMNRVMQIQEQLPEMQMAEMTKAERETKRQWQEQEHVLAHGMTSEEKAHYEELIKYSQENPDEPTSALQAQEAHKKLAEGQKRFGKPDPHRLWKNMSGWQQALFIALNAIGGGAAAMSGGGPTPLDIAMDLMEQDYEAQKEDYARQRGKVESARSAYALAARMTDNTMQRELMTKNMMLGGLETELRGANALQQAEAISMERQKLQAGIAQQNQQVAMQNVSNATAALIQQEKLAASERLAAMGKSVESAPPYGTAYMPGAPPLDKTKVRELQTANQGYVALQRGVSELLALRQDDNLMKQAMISMGVTDEAGVYRQKFAEIVDNVRDFYNWGARFEQTEAEKLVAGYLGSDDPTAADWFGKIEAGLDAFRRDMQARWTEGLHKGFGLRLTGQGATGAPGYNYETGTFDNYEYADPQAGRF